MRTNKTTGNALDSANLIAKSRFIIPGNVDPDGAKPVEEGGFRTDAPTTHQLAMHLLFSKAVRAKWDLRTFDVNTAFLSGKEQTRELYVRLPPDGLPGVPHGSLLKLIKGVYGLKEAPRLWYLRAVELIRESGWTELESSKATFVCRDPKTGELTGMLVLHVDDACYAGKGAHYEQCVKNLWNNMNLGKEGKGSEGFQFLGRWVKQNPDFSIEVDQSEYVRNLERVHIPLARRRTPGSPLTEKELHDYRSIVGQLAWPARETMPQLSYAVSDLQQRTGQATVKDLHAANKLVKEAQEIVQAGHKLRFPVLPSMHTTQVQLELSQQQDSKIKRYNKISSQDDPQEIIRSRCSIRCIFYGTA